MPNKIKLALLALLTVPFAAVADEPPRNTIDLSTAAARASQAQDAFSAVGVSGLPPEYTNYVVPNVQTSIAEQMTQYENSQLTPQQIQRMKAAQLLKQEQLSTPYLTVPKPIVRSISPSLAAGETPPILRVAKGLLTSVVFTDLQGHPWYIEKVVVNREQFNDTASINPDGSPTNILNLEPLQAISYGTVSVTLKENPVPVIFLLAAGQEEVDIRVDARMKGNNPDRVVTPFNTGGSVGGVDESSLSFLDGYIPPDATPLLSSDSSVNGWLYNNQIYVKSRFDVLYPAYSSRATSSDGVNIYRFSANARQISFLQRNGQPVAVTLDDAPYLEQLKDNLQ